MKQEDKELLLKDLSARLPYGVKCKDLVTDEDITLVGINCIYSDTNPMIISIEGIGDTYFYGIKPYLRPMSSMTEEEIQATNKMTMMQIFDYYNSIHIDYRGLIPKGLALEAPSDMYK